MEDNAYVSQINHGMTRMQRLRKINVSHLMTPTTFGFYMEQWLFGTCEIKDLPHELMIALKIRNLVSNIVINFFSNIKLGKG